MKKFLFAVLILTFAGAAYAQSAGAELDFYKKEAQGADKKLLSAIADTLGYWAARNHALPITDDALFLKGDIEVRTKNYPAAAITLLRHKYEYPKSANQELAGLLLSTTIANIERAKKPALEKLAAQNISAAAPLESRLAAFLSDATNLDLKNNFAALFAEYQNFFARFPSYEDNDKLELMLGDLYRAAKNYQAAIMQYRKVYEIYPSTKYKAASLRMMGDIYGGELKDYAQAMHYYNMVLNDYPASAERGITYKHMAILSDNQKDYAGAVGYITSAAELFIKHGQAENAYEALRYKANLLEKRLKDYSAAADTLNKTAQLFATSQNKYIDTKLKAADIYGKRLKDQYSQIAAYEDIISNFPSAPAAAQAMFDAAVLYEKTNAPLKARDMYQKLIVEHPSDPLANRAQKNIESIDKRQAKEAAKQ